MLTCKSPRKVMLVAHHFAAQVLPAHASKFSRQDFTLPQLFACLVLREQLRQSYRGIVAILKDARHWGRSIGMKKVPAYNTLCRAFGLLTERGVLGSLLDTLARWMALHHQLGKMLAIDSTLLDVRYRSRHYEQRCRHRSVPGRKNADKMRSHSAKRTPKLIVGVDTRSHFVVSVGTRTGMGSDAPHFLPSLREARRRNRKIKLVLADAGFDSHENHRVARQRLKVRSLIKTGCGRPSDKLPASHYRRQMLRHLKGSQSGKPYGQRAQAETVNSMLKRNLGDHLRARTPARRECEMALRVVVHNITII